MFIVAYLYLAFFFLYEADSSLYQINLIVMHVHEQNVQIYSK